jgi:uncharacterized protein DUF559
MAAVLATGDGAALSHRSAGALWGIRASTRSRIELTVRRRLHPQRGLHLRYGQLPADEVTTESGIPVTTVPRTLLDLAAVLPHHQVERAVNEAEVRRLTDAVSLADLAARHARRAGTRTIRAILEDGAIGVTVTRSELEARFLAFLDETGLPRPSVNSPLRVPGGWIEADCLWPAQRLIAELDGHATHRTPAAYEKDRERDRKLNAAGYRVIRITWRQLHTDPTALTSDLRTLLNG